ncbi:response regulator transcription factor [Thalassobacillus sp. C254]|uniref:response regulator transcription factor n=1 Tax=Thalassobacillus sp. C254 TaxID=1225341 RepID=UPI0006D0E34A|nr:response regulator [Thalassobacillus sp. C254]
MNVVENITYKVALLEDEPAHALLIGYNIEFKGHSIEHFHTGKELSLEIDSSYDLIILSLDLSKENPVTICQDIFFSGVEIPVLFVTTNSKQKEYNVSANYEILEKPFTLKELGARIDKLLINNYVQRS